MSESDPLSGAYCKRHDIYLCEWCTEIQQLQQQLAASERSLQVTKQTAADFESRLAALLEQLVRLLYPGEQWGHHGMHHGNGSPGCPKQLHHHHDDHCEVPTPEMILGEIKNLKESRDHYKEQADLDSRWRNMKRNLE